jgi:predicted AlkP superfamily pyrophosphatase or phosphodiesterase
MKRSDPTNTAPGHAATVTGSVPSQNGIVGTNWYDREALSGDGLE